MNLDAQAMLEVNRALIFSAARTAREGGQATPLVASVATFGRGIRHELLQQLEARRHAWGHNQSLVALPEPEMVQLLLKQPEWTLPPPPAQSEGFWALGFAFNKSSLEWWPWHEEDADGLF